MPRPHPGRTPVFHIIPIEKLASVLEHGLLCDEQSQERFGPQEQLDAAHAGLKAYRRNTLVQVAQGGSLDQYVPFYFGPRSPMLCATYYGQTEYSRSGRGQAGMIHLVCRLETLIRDSPGMWCFVDAHVTRGWAKFGDTLDELDARVDFDVMTLKYWSDPDEIKAARQAEFLVHGVVPWKYVEIIVVMADEVAAEVKAIVDASGSDHHPDVRVRPPGYYPDSPFPHGYYY